LPTASVTTGTPAAIATWVVSWLMLDWASGVALAVPDASLSLAAATETSAANLSAAACFSATCLASVSRSSSIPSPVTADTAITGTLARPSEVSSRRRSFKHCSRWRAESLSTWFKMIIMTSECWASGFR
jgi:hypothetical protein